MSHHWFHSLCSFLPGQQLDQNEPWTSPGPDQDQDQTQTEQARTSLGSDLDLDPTWTRPAQPGTRTLLDQDQTPYFGLLWSEFPLVLLEGPGEGGRSS